MRRLEWSHGKVGCSHLLVQPRLWSRRSEMAVTPEYLRLFTTKLSMQCRQSVRDLPNLPVIAVPLSRLQQCFPLHPGVPINM
jgi:hypothetical protein